MLLSPITTAACGPAAVHMRWGGTAGRASRVTLSTYITISLHKPLHKHDPLNTALGKILIKQKNSNHSPVPGHSWPRLRGAVTWEGRQCPCQAAVGLRNSLEGSSWPSANMGVCLPASSVFLSFLELQ